MALSIQLGAIRKSILPKAGIQCKLFLKVTAEYDAFLNLI
jgi:hypothetical protein